MMCEGVNDMAGLQLGEGAKFELLADLVTHEREKNIPEKEIEEKLILTYGLTRIEAAQLMTKN